MIFVRTSAGMLSVLCRDRILVPKRSKIQLLQDYVIIGPAVPVHLLDPDRPVLDR